MPSTRFVERFRSFLIRSRDVVARVKNSSINLSVVAVAAALVATAGWTARLDPDLTVSAGEARINRAVLDRDGNVRLPIGYRRWEHVGTRIKADGFSVLDGSRITTPQAMDAYVEPSAYEVFKTTGRWPDGSQLVKEYSLIKTGSTCSETNFVCSTVFGRGIFEDHYSGMGVMIKDSRHFSAAAGNWGYFSFLPAGTTYQPSASPRPREQCSSCHEKGAATTDYVFSKSHIGLLPGNLQ